MEHHLYMYFIVCHFFTLRNCCNDFSPCDFVKLLYITHKICSSINPVCIVWKKALSWRGAFQRVGGLLRSVEVHTQRANYARATAPFFRLLRSCFYTNQNCMRQKIAQNQSDLKYAIRHLPFQPLDAEYWLCWYRYFGL